MEKKEGFFSVDKQSFYDAVVVGSGYGGSVAACRLSMAGFNVCLIEKGRRWEAEDFPTDSFQMLSAVRMESRNLGLNFGSKDSLFQIYSQDDSVAMTACGLGGGSLVNAGVLLPTTARARRDPKWPKAWESDWERSVASALEMLRAQSIPSKFQNSKIMEKVIGDEYDTELNDKMKLTVNFDMEDRASKRGSCVACGNCLSGCPYNAKLSNDKTYLASAIQEGCTIITGCEVQYVVRNEDHGIFKTEKNNKNSRWLVFLDDFNYIEANIVILSAGVLGTAKILFQSQLRGLKISQKLGSGFSCNGSTAAFLAESPAPLNAVGLDGNKFSSFPFKDRPGPSISSAFTSSLGFTIQSSVVPRAYPRFLLKGIASYGPGSGFGFFYGIIEMMKHVLGLENGQEMVLNVIGHDDSGGKLKFDKETNRVFFQTPHDHLLPKKIEALKKLAKRIGGVLFLPKYRSLSVHLLGGCVAASDVSSGVCNPDGQVFDASCAYGVHSGLYICDASIIPTSVGVNPCLTIAAAAEFISRNLIRDSDKDTGYSRSLDKKPGLVCKKKENWEAEVRFTETMRGQIGGMHCAAFLKLRFRNSNTNKDTPTSILLRGEACGYIECKTIEVEKMHIIHGEVVLCKTNEMTPYTQYMHYHLLVAASSGARYEFDGMKTMNPFLTAAYAWQESTNLNVKLRQITGNKPGDDLLDLDGKLHLSPFELLKTVLSLKGGSRFKFVFILMQSLLRTYILQVPRGRHAVFDLKELIQERYPTSTMHEIKTEDGVKLFLQHWEYSQCFSELKIPRKLRPVLLLNGYATESYCLPTEKKDLVRTLLEDGHDVCLLHARCHWSVSSNNFTIDDIGRFDIPAAFSMINEFYGKSTKVHVIAHCLGGLAIHICLMGGHVSAERVASLSCTNSSMFYRVTAFSLVKLWLPLIPISMAILGKDTVLPMLEDSPEASFRHRMLKQIARLLPRCEHCTFDECNVFSGIFGSAYWHANISPRMHYWMHKENLPRLPLSAFPHLRKICISGFIVDSNGKNCYLTHPERMAVPTLYLSGGKTVLVTPETSFLAHRYMKMHQPLLRHERVVVGGYGHSDLWIGEKSHEDVFPFIRRHVQLAEEGKNAVKSCQEMEVLAWDSYEVVGFWSWRLVCLVVLLVLIPISIVGQFGRVV